jgi:hypothetical protein
VNQSFTTPVKVNGKALHAILSGVPCRIMCSLKAFRWAFRSPPPSNFSTQGILNLSGIVYALTRSENGRFSSSSMSHVVILDLPHPFDGGYGHTSSSDLPLPHHGGCDEIHHARTSLVVAFHDENFLCGVSHDKIPHEVTSCVENFPGVIHHSGIPPGEICHGFLYSLLASYFHYPVAQD